MWSFLVPAMLALSLLAGCGNRGGLFLPPKPQAVPANAATATPPPASEADRAATGNPNPADSSTAAAETQR